jgi:hypothetical protein
MKVELAYGHALRFSLTDKAELAIDSALAGSSFVFTGIATGETFALTFDEDGIAEPVFTTCDLYTDETGFVIEVVRNHYCSLDAVLDYGKNTGTSPRKIGVTEDDAFAARDRATAVIEEALGYCCVERVMREDLFVTAGRYTQLTWGYTRKFLSGNAELKSGSGILPFTSGAITVDYIHGMRAVPDDIASAVARLAAYYLTPTNTPERATGQSTDAGFLRFTVAGVDGETGIPEVDAVIKRRARTRLVMV